MALHIDKIAELPDRAQSFNEIVLPTNHRQMVLSLVEMHSIGTKPVESVGMTKPETASSAQEDLVRGKGKGLIILLHGKLSNSLLRYSWQIC